MQKAVDWFRANRDEAISILISYLKSDPKDVADTYDFFAKLHAFDRVGAVEGSGVENYLAILKRDGDLDGGTELAIFYDALLSIEGFDWSACNSPRAWKLNAAVVAALQRSGGRKSHPYCRHGATPTTPEEFSAFIESEIIKAAKIRALGGGAN